MKRKSGLSRRQMNLVAIVALTITSTPLVMIDDDPAFLKGSLVMKVSAADNPVEGAEIKLTGEDKNEIFLTTNRQGYAFLASVKKKKKGINEVNIDSGSYVAKVKKGNFSERTVRLFMPENGFVEKIIKLNQSNNPPIPVINSVAFAKPGTRVELDALKSRDPDQPVLDTGQTLVEEDFLDEFGNPNGKRVESYRWILASKPEGSKAFLENANKAKSLLIPDKTGSYEVALTLNDGLLSNTLSRVINCDFPFAMKAKLPQALGGHASSIVKGKAYIIGGWNNVFLNYTYEYDFKKDKWTIKTPLKTPRNHHLTFNYKGKIYVVGGHNQGQYAGISQVEVYNPDYDSWDIAAEMPTPRYTMSGNLFEGKFYTFGGQGGAKTIEVYDPFTDTWEKKKDMPIDRFRHTSSVVKGKFYLIGGRGTERMVQEFDPKTSLWKTKTPIPDGRYYHKSVVLEDKIYVIGGYSPTRREVIKEVALYDPATDTWKELSPVPLPVDIHSMNVFNKKIYIFGGEGLFGQSSTQDATQVYNPFFEGN